MFKFKQGETLTAEQFAEKTANVRNAISFNYE